MSTLPAPPSLASTASTSTSAPDPPHHHSSPPPTCSSSSLFPSSGSSTATEKSSRRGVAKKSGSSTGSSKARSVKTEGEKAQNDDWRAVNVPEERRRIQNRLAQRKFRLKANEAQEFRHRTAENQLHAGNSYTIPDSDDVGLEPKLSGLPWGGLSMHHFVKATKGGSN